MGGIESELIAYWEPMQLCKNSRLDDSNEITE